MICSGCEFQHKMTYVEQTAEIGETSSWLTCAFCRTTLPKSDEEKVAQLSKRVELKDPIALYNMAGNYDTGRFGLSVDQTKCLELLHQAVDLDYPDAQYTLGNFYEIGAMGLEQNEGKARKYWEKAAEGGDIDARHNLGYMERENGNDVAAMHHWRLSASVGYGLSMKFLIEKYFENGLLRHGDLAETLQAFYRAKAEMKSDDRDEHIKHMKKKEEYEEEDEH